MELDKQGIPLEELIRQDPRLVIHREDSLNSIEPVQQSADGQLGKIFRLGALAAACAGLGLTATVMLGGSSEEPSNVDAKQSIPGPVKPHKKAAPAVADPATFHAVPTACEPSVEIAVDSITPILWTIDINGTKIYKPEKDNFPGLLKGSAEIISCITDTSAYKLDAEATKRSGVQTYDVDASKASFVLDTTGLTSQIRSYPDKVILQALRTSDPTATRYDAMSLNQFLQKNSSNIEVYNINNLLSGLSATYTSEITDIIKADLLNDIQKTLADEKISENKVAFKFTNFPADILPLSYKLPALPTADTFMYLKDESATKVAINEVTTPSEKEKS
jgi:hypothetical protein